MKPGLRSGAGHLHADSTGERAEESEAGSVCRQGVPTRSLKPRASGRPVTANLQKRRHRGSVSAQRGPGTGAGREVLSGVQRAAACVLRAGGRARPENGQRQPAAGLPTQGPRCAGFWLLPPLSPRPARKPTQSGRGAVPWAQVAKPPRQAPLCGQGMGSTEGAGRSPCPILWWPEEGTEWWQGTEAQSSRGGWTLVTRVHARILHGN